MFDPANTTLSEGVIALRLLLAVGLGAVIGFEREQLARAAKCQGSPPSMRRSMRSMALP